MPEAKYPSKERVERDGVLVYAEGDDLLNDPDEAKRQGYKVDDDFGPDEVVVSERVERDGVLVAAEGDVITAEEAKELGIKGAKPAEEAEPTPKKAPAAAKKS